NRMILFWLICAGLVAIALAFVLPTLLQRAAVGDDTEKERANVEVYRDQLSELDADLANGIVSPEQYPQDRDEIERRLLDDVGTTSEASEQKPKPAAAGRGAVYAVSFGIPVVAVILYLLVGNSAALSGVPPQALTGSGPQSDGQMSQPRIEANVAALAKRLGQNPGDADGWAMLGRSYVDLERYGDASNAYAKAAELKKQALRIAPENPKVLQLAGTAEFEAKNYKQAIVYWQKLLAMTSDNP